MAQVAIYLRVSTLDQEKGIRSQEKAITDYVQGHDIEGVRWYRDRISGNSTKRPALDRLEKAIFMGRVNQVIVWRLDRLSRKGARDGLNLLAHWLEKGVRVVSVTEQFDLYGDVGEIIAGVLFGVARMYRTALIENTKRGMAAAKAKGVKLGKRPKLFARDIVPLLEQGLGIAQVAKQLGKSRQAIYDCLRREGVDVGQLCVKA